MIMCAARSGPVVNSLSVLDGRAIDLCMPSASSDSLIMKHDIDIIQLHFSIDIVIRPRIGDYPIDHNIRKYNYFKFVLSYELY